MPPQPSPRRPPVKTTDARAEAFYSHSAARRRKWKTRRNLMSNMAHRIRKTKGHLTTNHKKAGHLRPVEKVESLRGPAKVEEVAAAEIVDHYLATQRKPLEDVEPIWILRWLLRRYFKWRGFACRSHCGECDGKCYASIEYRGTFENKGDAYYAANCRGGEVKPIPFNAALPEETVAYGVGDVPQCEEPEFYRNGVELPFITIPRERMAQLEEKVEEVFRSASA